MSTLQDKLGRTVAVGDRVAYASFYNQGLTIGTVTRLGRIRAQVIAEDTSFSDESESLRTTELIKI